MRHICLGALCCALALVASFGCSGDAPACVTPADAGTLPMRIEVDAAASCGAMRVAVPAREPVACHEAATGAEGARIQLVGRPGVWTIEVERTDAMGAVCAGVLDEAGCACITSGCSDGSGIRPLSIRLENVSTSEVQLSLSGGTYTVQLCIS